jgi:hypothetical protein
LLSATIAAATVVKNTTAASTADAVISSTPEIAPVSSPLTIAAISWTPETAVIS